MPEQLTASQTRRERVENALTARRLAGDERAGVWARSQARLRWFEFVRERWLLLVAMVAVAGIPITGLVLLSSGAFLRGLIVGAGVTGTAALLCALVRGATGTAWMTAGATAEQWSAQELRRLRGDGYRLFNHVFLSGGDIDHVLVGPAGVVAVETKWSATPWTDANASARITRAVDQVGANARKLRLWSPLHNADVTVVRPVVFLWSISGPDNTQNTPATEKLRIEAGATIVTGKQAARTWIERVRQSPATLTADQIAEIYAALENQIRRRDNHELTEAPPTPPTLEKIYWSALGGVAAFLAALLIGTAALPHLASWAWPLLLAAQLGAGWRASKITRLRLAAKCWQSGVAVVTLIAATTMILNLIG